MQPPPKTQAQKPDASPQDTEMTDEPRGHSPPHSQGTTFIHQATPLENQNFADLLAPNPSKGRLPKQAKQVVQAPTGLSSSLFNPEIRKEVQRTTARVALSEAMPVLTPLPPNHKALRKRRASKSPDKAGHNAPKITALKHMYTNAQRATLAKLDANAEATSRKSLSSRKNQAEMEPSTQNNPTSEDLYMDIDELSQDPAIDVQCTKPTKNSKNQNATTKNSSSTSE